MKNTCGTRIKEKRKDMGLTQEQLAELMNTTKGTISFYENDNVDIKLSVLRELAQILKTTVGYLADGDEIFGDMDYEIANVIRKLKSEESKKVALEQIKLLERLL